MTAPREETALVPSGPQVIVIPARNHACRTRARYARWAAAAAGVLLLVLGTLFMFEEVGPAVATPRPAAVQIGDTRGTATPVIVLPQEAPAASGPQEVVRPPRTTERAATRRPQTVAPPRRSRPATPQRKQSLFEREIIRLVFR